MDRSIRTKDDWPDRFVRYTFKFEIPLFDDVCTRIISSYNLDIRLEGPADFLPLTPAHFLIGRPLVAPACEDVSQTEISLLSRYKRIEHIRRLFWKRWATEYISEMQHRRKWQEGQESLEPDTLVLIKDDNSPPLMWSLGRIVRTFKGRDGISRVADVRTSSGIIRRSYPKLCPLFRN